MSKNFTSSVNVRVPVELKMLFLKKVKEEYSSESEVIRRLVKKFVFE